jgi:UDP-N-acetylglucosamine 2-epimerase (hydrolysing)
MNRNGKRRVLFLTGTRADYGKLKPLIDCVERTKTLEARVFATGMHMLARYGSTVDEIFKAGHRQVFSFINQDASVTSQMDLILANTIQGLGHYLREFPADLIIVHGDRVEALAGAIVGSLNNVLVGHIEGGEVSGTIDELIRHSVSKLSHVHFVSNTEARKRLIQMGELPSAIFTIGSPDIDVMLSKRLPALAEVRRRYDIPSWKRYGIALYHPVTTELDAMRENAVRVVRALEQTGMDFVVIFPNNDSGSEAIIKELKRLQGNPHFRILSSMRFQYFLTLMKNAAVMVGNSSAGIREAPVYGVPTINIGSRQNNRFRHESITDVVEDTQAILNAIKSVPGKFAPTHHFGSGKSADLFISHLKNSRFWLTPRQKQFRDVEFG